MDKAVPQSELHLDKIAPPVESHISTVLNGIGNGMMIGAVPLVMLNLYDEVKKGTINSTRNKWGIGLTVVSCALGGWFGVREAESLKGYREEVSSEVLKLREQVAANSASMKEWTERMAKHEQQSSKAPVVAR